MLVAMAKAIQTTGGCGPSRVLSQAHRRVGSQEDQNLLIVGPPDTGVPSLLDNASPIPGVFEGNMPQKVVI
jgi:hypothetical protein